MAVTAVSPAELTSLVERVSSGVLAHERLIPVADGLAGMLPLGGIRRGGSLATAGPAALSLALAFAATASQQGAWVAFVGFETLGLAATIEYGLVPGRMLVVAVPTPDRWAEVVALAAEGIEVVIARPPRRLSPGEIRRVQARLAGRGSVLIVVEPSRSPAQSSAKSSAKSSEGGGGWPSEVHLVTGVAGWEGVGEGHGRLLARRVTVDVSGRRVGSGRRVELFLPGPSGRVELVEERGATVTPLRRVG